ncbi:MAG: hypothetical protein ABR987_05450 [Terracidiphilus sp.]
MLNLQHGRSSHARQSPNRRRCPNGQYAATLAIAPIGSVITEFLADVARGIHARVVLIQRIINQVANKDAGNSSP